MFFKIFDEERITKKARKEATLRLVEEQLSLLREHRTIHMIDIQRICPADRPKRQENPQELKNLCDSISKYGLLEPLTVRRITPDNSSLGGIFTLISGHRRLEALKMLGMQKVPCVICQLKAPAVLPALCSSLLHTKQVTLFEQCELVEQMRSQRCLSDKEIAAALSLDEQQIKTLRAYRALEEDERTLCLSAELPSYLVDRLAAIRQTSERKRWLVEIVHTLRTIFPDDRHPFAKQAAQSDNRRMLFSDIRPFYNSIEQMVHRMRAAGISATTEQTETDEYYELTLRVSKESKVRIMHNSKDLSKGA